MGPDALDQEAINNLLQADTSAGSGEDKHVSTFAVEIVGSLVNTLLSLTQKNVDAKKSSEELTTLGALSERINEDIIISQTKLSKNLKGELAFGFNIKAATVISDLVMMGSGNAKEALSQDDMDALKETTNQAYGLSAQQISAIVGKEVSCEPAKLQIIKASEQKDKLPKLFEENKIYAFTFLMNIEGVESFKVYFFINASIKDFLALAEKESASRVEQKKATKETELPAISTEAEDEDKGFSVKGEVRVEADKAELKNVELIKGIEVDVKIKLGETIMPLKKIMRLAPGSIIELNKNVESYLELVINGRPIAEGVLVVVPSNNFGLRITNVLDKAERIKRLGSVEDD